MQLFTIGLQKLTKGGTPIDPGRLPTLPTLGKRQSEMAYHVAIFPNTAVRWKVIISPHRKAYVV